MPPPVSFAETVIVTVSVLNSLFCSGEVIFTSGGGKIPFLISATASTFFPLQYRGYINRIEEFFVEVINRIKFIAYFLH